MVQPPEAQFLEALVVREISGQHLGREWEIAASHVSEYGRVRKRHDSPGFRVRKGLDQHPIDHAEERSSKLAPYPI
jgi:hypothetical protein